MAATLAFTPDYAVPPGETLREVLEMKGVSQADLAARTGLTEKTISQIVNGAAPLSYETAGKLELSLGISASFWNTRESQFREALIRIEEASRLQSETEWLKLIPVKELTTRGVIPTGGEKGQLVRQLLKFFQVSTVDAWNNVWVQPQCQFRGAKAQDDHPGFVAAWLRLGEIAAEKVECTPYDESAFREALTKIRALTTQPTSIWQPELVRLCAAAGVAVVLVREIAGASVSGIAKWLNKDKALIQLSLRYKSDDQFWFTFFHEACHILKHSKKTVFYENGKGRDTPEEHEANKFAADFLIPPTHVRRFASMKSKASIMAFANEIGVSPGIVVGRLQHDKLLAPRFCNDLKRKYVWSEPNAEEGHSA